MFEGILNGLLERFLSPYVEGLSPEKLRLAYGSVELRDLVFKPTLLATLGIDVLELSRGKLQHFRLQVPLSALFSGRIRIEIHGLDFYASVREQRDATTPAEQEKVRGELRSNRRARVAARVEVLKQQLENERLAEVAEEVGEGTEEGLGSKIGKQVLSSLEVDISDIGAGLECKSVASEWHAKLGQVKITSPDSSSPNLDDAKVPGSVLRKQASVVGLSIVGGSVPLGLQPALEPLGLVLGLNFDQVAKCIKVNFEFGHAEGAGHAGLSISDVHIQTLAKTLAILGVESQRLGDLLVPPAVAELVDLSTTTAVDAVQKEFLELERRRRKDELALEAATPLGSQEEWRLEVLLDTVPEELLSHWVLRVDKEAEVAQAKLEQKKQQDAPRRGWFGRMFKGSSSDASANAVQEAAKDLSKLYAEAEGVSAIDAPTKYEIRIHIPKLALKVMHMSCDGGLEDSSLVASELNALTLEVSVELRTDYRGYQSAAFTFHSSIHSADVSHRGHTMLHTGVYRSISTGGLLRKNQIQMNSDGGLHAFVLDVENRLEQQRTVFHVNMVSQPYTLVWRETFIPALLAFKSAVSKDMPDTSALRMQALANSGVALDDYLQKGEEWIQSDQAEAAFQKARDHLPDAFELSMDISGPRVKIPMHGNGRQEVSVSLGNLSLAVSTLAATSLRIGLANASLLVVDAMGLEHRIVNPFKLQGSVNLRGGGSGSSIETDLHLDKLSMQASPEALTVILAVPGHIQASLQSASPGGEAEATNVADKTPKTLAKQKEQEEALQSAEDLAQEKAAAIAERARAYMQKARARTQDMEIPEGQSVRLTCSIGQLMILFLDAASPVLSLDSAIRSLELECQLGSGQSLQLSTKQVFEVAVRLFNVRVGRFEPVVEPFEFATHATLPHNGEANTVRILGHRPLNLNVSPTAVQVLTWYIPHMLETLQEAAAESAHTRGARYRFLNLTSEPLKMIFRDTELEADEEVEELLAPTGAAWKALDKWITPSQCEAVGFGTAPDLELVKVGAVAAQPGTFIQLLRPRVDYALLIFSSAGFVLNHTTLPLFFRFADGGKLTSSNSNCGSISLLEGDTEEAEEPEDVPLPEELRQECGDGVFVVRPGEFAAVPLGACSRSDTGALQMRAEVRAQGGSWSAMQTWSSARSGDSAPSSCISCGTTVHIASRASSTVTAPPAREPMIYVDFWPVVSFASGLPCPIDIEYQLLVDGSDVDADGATQCGRCEVGAFGKSVCYDLSSRGKVRVRMKFLDGQDWSSWTVANLAGTQHEEGLVEESQIVIQKAGCASCALTVAAREGCEIAVFSSSWIIDRTGWELTAMSKEQGRFGVQGEYSPLVKVRDVSFVSAVQGEAYALSREGKQGKAFGLTVGSSEWTLTSLADNCHVCLRASKLPAAELQKCHVTCYELVPRLIFCNTTGCIVEVRTRSSASKTSKAVTVQIGERLCPELPAGSLEFRVLSSASLAPTGQSWSKAIPVDEQAAGAVPFHLDGCVWMLEVRPDNGMICFLLRAGSDYIVRNTLTQPIEVRIRGLKSMEVAPEEDLAVGWLDPCGADMERLIGIATEGGETAPFDPRAKQVRTLSEAFEVMSVLSGVHTTLEVREKKKARMQVGTAWQLELLIPKLGISCTSRRAGAMELLYLELELLRACVAVHPDEDVQLFDISISDMQCDWQASLEQKAMQPIVMMANSGESSHNAMKPFFRLVAQRDRTSSPELYFRAIRIEIDEVEIGVSDEQLLLLQKFATDAVARVLALSTAEGTVAALSDGRGPVVSAALQRAGQGLTDSKSNWQVPPMQQILQVDELRVSAVVFHVWCTMRLEMLHFLPPWTRLMLRTMTFSSRLELQGSTLTLSPKDINSGTRGSVGLFAQSLTREYIGDVVKSLASVLGNSSLLNVPRAPLKLGGAGLQNAAGAMTTILGTASSYMASATGDQEYKDKQAAARKSKHIEGIWHGATEAVSDIGDGVSGMLDFIRKPVQGAREGGAVGFVKGVGTGVVSSVAKPLGAVGNAFSDIGSGVAAQVSSVTTRTKRVQHRRRLPRLLAGPLGAMVEYSVIEAWASSELQGVVEHIEAVVPLAQLSKPPNDADDAEGWRLLTLVLASASVVLAQLNMPSDVLLHESSENLKSYDVALLQHLAVDVPLWTSPENPDSLHHVHTCWSGVVPLDFVAWESPADAGNKFPKLLVSAQGKEASVPAPWEASPELAHALHTALLSLSIQGSNAQRAHWMLPFRAAFLQARMASLRTEAVDMVQTCVVWEVQRASMGSWKTPYMPTLDTEHKHRWMDVGLKKRHQLLDPEADLQSAQEPPIKMLSIWTTSEAWHWVGEDADAEGWQYATSWESSVWRDSPRPLFDMVRRRRWEREYRLGVSQDGSVVDSQWLNADSNDDSSFLSILCCCYSKRPKPKGPNSSRTTRLQY